MTPDERELVRTVLADLKYLRDEWDEAIEEDALRRNSPVLRRLLIEGDYSRAWRAVGLAKEPRIKSFDMAAQVQGLTPERISFAQHGGANYNGMRVLGATAYSGVLSDAEMKARAERTLAMVNNMAQCGLTEFMKQTCMFVGGRGAGLPALPVTRHQLIKYVANKRGGAHYDTSRSPLNKSEMVYLALDGVFKMGSCVAELQSAYFELLSIGRAIADSDDAQAFTERASQALGHS